MDSSRNGGTRLIIAGGGSAEQSRPLDERMARWLGPGATLLYLPVALAEGHPMLAGCEGWIHSVFDPLGVGRIVTWHAGDLARPDRAEALRGFDGVYIGGGNTYRLLDLLRRSGMDRELAALARAGVPISGGSAGAVILGKDIGFAEALGDPNEAGLLDTAGLDLLRDDAGRSWMVIPHFSGAWRGKAEALARASMTGVVGIPEDGGLVVENGVWEEIGQVTIIDAGAPGC